MSELLSREFLGVAVEQWLLAIGLALLVPVLLALFRRIAKGRLTEKQHLELADFEKNRQEARKKFRDSLSNMQRNTRKSVVFVLSAYAAMLLFSLPEEVTAVGKQIATLAFLLQLGWWGTGLIDYWFTLEEKQKHLAEGLKTLASVAVWVIIILIALDSFGYDISGAMTGLGVASVAVALATQRILGDLLAFFSITSDEPFKRGDFLVIGEYSGNVEHIGLRSTRIRSLSGEQLIFSNGDLLESRIQNYKTLKSRRIVVELSVEKDTPYEKVEAVPAMVREIVKPIDGAALDRAHFRDYGESSLDFEIVYIILNPDYKKYMDIREKINLEILKRFEAEGIRFALPHQTIQLEGGVS